MKRLYWLVIKSFLGPFILTFFIVMFVLLMQFLWRYIDELVGKGLEFLVISELLIYTSASLVAMALPLSILMSSLMTFGNLSEYNELSAMKSSGISLQKILMPLIIFIFFVSIIAFFFSNNVLPVANLKMRTLLWDIRQQRPEVSIREGEFYNGVDNYSIRVNKKNPQTNVLYDWKIYDHTAKRGNVSVIVADSGTMKITMDKKRLVVTLWDGYSYNEEEEDRRKREKTYPHSMHIFKEQIINIELTGFGLERSDEKLFKNNYQMMSLRQLNNEIDSLNTDLSGNEKKFKRELLTSNYFLLRDYYRSKKIVTDTIKDKLKDSLDVSTPLINVDSLLNSLSSPLQISVIETALNHARSAKIYVESSHGNLHYKKRQLRKHEIEWHKKFTLSIGCLIFLLVGAPLGAIIRKGGLGMPTVISVILFIFWYIISLIGEKIVRESIIPSYQGIWISSVVFLVVGIFLLYKATTDSALFNIDVYLLFFRKLFGIEKDTMLDKKLYLVGKFEYTEIDRESIIESLNSIKFLSSQSSEKIKKELKFTSFIPSFINQKETDEFKKLIKVYNNAFDSLLTSKWTRISYIKNKLTEYPYLDYDSKLLSSKYLRILSVIIFPVLFIHLIRQLKLIKRLVVIGSVSQDIVNGLNNHNLLAELELENENSANM